MKLTELTSGGGCGCKIAPSKLNSIIGNNEITFPGLIIGNETRDDAAVYEWDEDYAVISTVDFFTPVVNDPYLFGKIAAANAVSDIYAMGGNPLMAVAVLGFPAEKYPIEIPAKIMEGGRDLCKEINIPVAGGHSILNPEPFFGLSVTGRVNKKYIKKNIGAKAGDLIYITKPLGSGILNVAVKKGLIKSEHELIHINNLLQINKAGAWLGELEYIHAMTDITGFGLLGHLTEMTGNNAVSASINSRSVPLFPFLIEYTEQNCIPSNTYKNWSAYETGVNGLVEKEHFHYFNDPQTNGGLMIAVNPNYQLEFENKCLEKNLDIFMIGNFIERKSQNIYII